MSRAAALLLLALGVCAAMARAAEDAVRPAGTPAPALPAVGATGTDDLWDSTGLAPAAEPQRRLVRRERAPAGSPSAAAKSASASWVRTAFSLVAVLGLIGLLAWGYRAAAGGRLALPGRVRNMGVLEVVARCTLAPRQGLCLVRVGPRLVLVGLTPTSVTALDVITDAGMAAGLLGEAQKGRAGSGTDEFNKLLRGETQLFAAADGAPRAAAAPADDQRTADVRAKLAETLERVRARAT